VSVAEQVFNRRSAVRFYYTLTAQHLRCQAWCARLRTDLRRTASQIAMLHRTWAPCHAIVSGRKKAGSLQGVIPGATRPVSTPPPTSTHGRRKCDPTPGISYFSGARSVQKMSHPQALPPSLNPSNRKRIPRRYVRRKFPESPFSPFSYRPTDVFGLSWVSL